ncbi:hypothetical protein ACU6ZK_18905 [Klebsiella aerogenes]|uniref:hypothetical protein n=1 Tax=Klebsiella aerogenes TaxID=548 RepID=UPI0006653FFD|nr:hypothetical protein [Klebsiella aerogenes]
MKKTLLAVLVLGSCVSSSVFAGDAGSFDITADVASAQCRTTTTSTLTVNPTVAQLRSTEGFVDSAGIDIGFENCDPNDSIKVTATATSNKPEIQVYLANKDNELSESTTSSIQSDEETNATGNANAKLFYKLKAIEGASSSSLAGKHLITVKLETEYN